MEGSLRGTEANWVYGKLPGWSGVGGLQLPIIRTNGSFCLAATTSDLLVTWIDEIMGSTAVAYSVYTFTARNEVGN